MTFEIQILICK